MDSSRSEPSAPQATLVILLVTWAVLAVAFAITSWVLPGMEISGGLGGYIWVSALFGILNAVIGTILRTVGLPLSLLALGLLSLILTAILLAVTDAISDNLTIDEFWWTAVWA
ncbi:MAG: phage holin family protein, partial [Gaiellaceae bacterium]